MPDDEIYNNKYFLDLEKIYQNQTFFTKNRIFNVFQLIGMTKDLKILI